MVLRSLGMCQTMAKMVDGFTDGTTSLQPIHATSNFDDGDRTIGATNTQESTSTCTFKSTQTIAFILR